MPTDQILHYLTAGIAALVTISVPLGLLGSALEHFGKTFRFPRVETLGDKIEKFFFDLPGLLTRKPSVPPAALVLLVAACSLPLSACAGVNWPKVLQCAGELQQPVLDSVTKVLHGNGDVESELADVARQHGAGVVECAVQQVIEDLTSKPSASVVEARAVQRGREFLASVQR